MSISMTLPLWFAVPAATTMLWLYAAIRSVWHGTLDRDDAGMLLVFWACTTVPALLAGWLA